MEISSQFYDLWLQVFAINENLHRTSKIVSFQVYNEFDSLRCTKFFGKSYVKYDSKMQEMKIL